MLCSFPPNIPLIVLLLLQYMKSVNNNSDQIERSSCPTTHLFNNTKITYSSASIERSIIDFQPQYGNLIPISTSMVFNLIDIRHIFPCEFCENIPEINQKYVINFYKSASCLQSLKLKNA